MSAQPLAWKTAKRKVKDLVPWEFNPRRMTEKQAADLTESLKRLNLISIPAVDTNNRIVSGHQRVAILIALGRGDETIDVRVPSRPLTDEEYREANIRENKNTGEWDVDALSSWDVESLVEFGFDVKEIEKMFNLDAGAKGGGAPPEMPAGMNYHIMIDCDSESHQREVFDRLKTEGLKCRPLML